MRTETEIHPQASAKAGLGTGLAPARRDPSTLIRRRGLASAAIARCLGLLALFVSSTGAEANPYQDYAAACRAQIGEIPAFSCADGVTIPVTINGVEPAGYTPGMTCDRPSLLPNGPESDGQCVPGSRILDLSTEDKQISVMCRQKHIRPADSLYFDEIDIIAHNPASGATCWFQASAVSASHIDGTTIPSPTDPASSTFFNAPQAVVHDGCGTCHDNDPFMYSPFVGQVWDHVPVNPFGLYFHVDTPGLGFDTWPTTHIAPRDSTCTGCHRIGVHETCGQLTDWATARALIPGADPRGASYPLSHSMPPFHGLTERAWDTINTAAVDDIAACCLDPTQTFCNAKPIPRGE
ncbi:MAG: hypothetical protein QNJ44_04640 [Rhodobacter sp.]|nr:hypothetical protein [Rhodobacter sp.]